MPGIGASLHLFPIQCPMTGVAAAKPPIAGRARKRTLVPSFGAPTSFCFQTVFTMFLQLSGNLMNDRRRGKASSSLSCKSSPGKSLFRSTRHGFHAQHHLQRHGDVSPLIAAAFYSAGRCFSIRSRTSASVRSVMTPGMTRRRAAVHVTSSGEARDALRGSQHGRVWTHYRHKKEPQSRECLGLFGVRCLKFGF